MIKDKIYLARVTTVTKVAEGPSKGRVQIWVTPVDSLNRGYAKIEVHPPSFIPTSTTGSGVYTVPPKGQLCLVWEHSDEASAYILNYVNLGGTTFQGLLSQDSPSQGSFKLKMGGLTGVQMEMTREGTFKWMADPTNKVELTNSTKKWDLTTHNYYKRLAGGQEEQTLTKDNKAKHKLSFFANKDWQAFSDWKNSTPWEVDGSLKTQSLVPHPVTTQNYSYTSKWGRYINTKEEGPLYSDDTREGIQALQNPDKTVLTWQRRGWREDYTSGEVDFPGGTLWDKATLKNFTGNKEFIYDRWGKIDKNTQNSGFNGELRRFSAFSGNKGGNPVPFGTPLTDPVPLKDMFTPNWEEKDWKEGFIQSWGELTGDVDAKLKNSLFRAKFFQKDDILGEKFKREEIWNGEEGNRPFWSQLTRETASLTLKKEEILHLDPFEWVQSLETDDQTIKTQFLPQEYLKEVIYPDFSKKEINNADKWELTLTHGDNSVKIEASGDKLTMTTQSGAKITLDGENIKLLAGDVSLKLNEGKFTVGNSSAELMDILNQALLALSTTTAPGYGAPISSVATFGQLYSKLKGLGP